MFLNKRMAPAELMHYQALEIRKKLNKDEQTKMFNLEKGFAGEKLYDKIFNEIGHENVYVLRDVYLKIGKVLTQYDSIIVTNNGVSVNEIKNLSGDYEYKGNKWYKNASHMENNPYVQLSRAESKLIKLSNDTPISFQVDGKVIFMNDDFRFSAEDKNIENQTIMINYLRNYFREYKAERLNENAKKIVLLIRDTVAKNSYFVEHANITKLKRGLYCGSCKQFDLAKGQFQFICNSCGSVESYETHIVRAISDHKYLFSNQPITKQSLLHLIDYQVHTTTVSKFLRKYCNQDNKGKASTHIFKFYDSVTALSEIRKRQRYKDKVH